MSQASHVLMVTGSRDWDSQAAVTDAISALFDEWLDGPVPVTIPVLISGACPTGADQLAEQVWSQPRFPIHRMPADWDAHGRRAGFVRNQEMVDQVVIARDAGAVVNVIAFADLCKKPDCPQAAQQDLREADHWTPGHFSHGTMHARRAALDAGLDVRTIVHPALPPF